MNLAPPTGALRQAQDEAGLNDGVVSCAGGLTPCEVGGMICGVGSLFWRKHSGENRQKLGKEAGGRAG